MASGTFGGDLARCCGIEVFLTPHIFEISLKLTPLGLSLSTGPVTSVSGLVATSGTGPVSRGICACGGTDGDPGTVGAAIGTALGETGLTQGEPGAACCSGLVEGSGAFASGEPVATVGFDQAGDPADTADVLELTGASPTA